MPTVKPVKRTKTAKQHQQPRQSATVTPDILRVITDRKTLAEASSLVKHIQAGGWSLRRLSRNTWRGAERFGFWQHVKDNDGQVKLTWLDVKTLRSIADLIDAGAEQNERLMREIIGYQEENARASMRVVRIAQLCAEMMKEHR